MKRKNTHTRDRRLRRPAGFRPAAACLLTVCILTACLLTACGPEPGREDQDGGALFGQGEPVQAEPAFGQTAPEEASEVSEAVPEGSGSAQTAETGAEAAGSVPAAPESGAGNTGGAEEGAGSGASAAPAYPGEGRLELHGDLKELDEEALEDLQAWLNEDSSCGFLLSTYERPEDIDQDLVLHAGGTERMDIQCTDAWEQGDTYVVHYKLLPREQEASRASASAVYQPVYEAQLVRSGETWQFRSNIFWLQKDLIEAQSYRADLAPVGEVVFAPFYPDTDADERADVSFALVRGRALYALLAPVEEGNVRTDRIFNNVEAVDFTDYNGDGYTDILTICGYTMVGEDGRKGGVVREARVYTGQKDGIPQLDTKKTGEVNSSVETLNITAVTEYLAGRSDGKAKEFSSWKEAFADHIRGLESSEYRGFALIYVNDDRTPELAQIGATTAKGATVVVYRNGSLEETWLNRNSFRYLEYENVLYSASGMENLHYDSIYSIISGRLEVSIQGYYGNSRFACIQYDDKDKPVYDYNWDGGSVSASGYRSGLDFVFDSARAKTCGAEDLLTAEEMLEKLGAEQQDR